MQKHCVIARFDNDTNQKLSKLKKDISDMLNIENPSNWPPHITLAGYEDMDIESLCQWTKEYSKRFSVFDITFDSLGVFCHTDSFPDTKLIYAVPTLPKSLTEFYYGFHDKLDEFSGQYGWHYTMKYGQPAFHSTIVCCKSEDFYRVFKYLQENFVSIAASITALEVYENPMKLVARYELTNL